MGGIQTLIKQGKYGVDFYRAVEAETFIWQKQTDTLFRAELVFQMHSGNGFRMSPGQKKDISETFA
jgi:hypothetical protein